MSRRFYIQRKGRLYGPYPVADVIGYIGGNSSAPLCPEGADYKDRRHWQAARVFPEFRQLIKKPPPREQPAAQPLILHDRPAPPPDRRGFYSTLAVGILSLVIWQGLKTPLPPTPVLVPAVTGGEQAAKVFIPACGKTVGELAGGSPTIENLGNGDYLVSWDDIHLSYDEVSGEVQAESAAAKNLFDLRTPCP
jgi:hypothetical protein